LKFLIDTGVDISVVKDSCLKPGYRFKPDKTAEIKGISNGVVRTSGTVSLRLFSEYHESVHYFHVIGDKFQLQFDGVLGRDFWERAKAVITYCIREIRMEDVVVRFDPKDNSAKKEISSLTLKARSENIVKLPTTCKGIGLLLRR
jgi:hypothetical protein